CNAGYQEEKSLMQKETDNRGPGCSQCEADTDLAGAGTHTVGHNSIEPHGAEQRRQPRKEFRQEAQNPLGGDAAIDLCLQGPNIVNRQLLVDCTDLAFDLPNRQTAVSPGSDQQCITRGLTLRGR